jgi:PKD repeat protein
MKQFFTFLLSLLITSAAFAQTQVFVKGTVKYSNGNPVANKAVRIYSDSLATPSGCYVVHYKYTNSAGQYSDTLGCNTPGAITIVKTATENCNGTMLINTNQVNTSTNLVESNFTICTPQANCVANFTFNVSGLTASFVSTSVPASGATIIGYSWNFGNGATSTLANPSVTYTAAGMYQVKLAITTAVAGSTTGSCSDTITKTIMVQGVLQGCQASFTNTANGNIMSFNSSLSTTAIGDSIKERNWRFGDGSTLGGNVVSPSHTYATAGTYTTCLKTISWSGCIDSICKTVTTSITPPTTCVAQFTISPTTLYTVNPMAFFGAWASLPSSSSDQIIKYIWNFGDATYDSSGVYVSHIYPAYGTYQPCLKIITAAGCIKTECKSVVLIDSSQLSCNANFTFNNNGLANGVYQFTNTSTSATPTATTYLWSFGNGTTSTLANPIVTFGAAGTYNVCLKIQAANGCRDSICKTIVVAPTTTCVASFTSSFLQGKTYQFNSSASVAANSTDVIVKRRWVFGDGSIDSGNVVSPVHSYANYGIYNVCLTIKTAAGCEKTTCITINITPPAQCNAAFTSSALMVTTPGWSVKFNSNISTANDTIVERKWTWGDGTSTGGNIVDPTHVFLTNGTYTVCLKIRSANGCSDSTCSTITVPFPSQLYCAANFTYTPQGQLVKFNGRSSAVPAGDSIIQYKWEYGDGQIQTGLLPEPQHQYAQTGLYNVCLTIKTSRGCESKTCKAIVVPQATIVQCVPHFTFERVLGAARTIRFNSATSWVPTNDSIIERKWTFGDGSTPLLGNVVNPLKQYATGGIYTACLRIKTALGCINEFCQPVPVDSGYVTPPNSGLVKIISLYPNPCTVQLSTVVWCGVTNLSAQLAIYDVYGVRKWSVQKTLLAGNNFTVIPTSQLASGPYFFRVTTMYGVQSKPFYKF